MIIAPGMACQAATTTIATQARLGLARMLVSERTDAQRRGEGRERLENRKLKT